MVEEKHFKFASIFFLGVILGGCASSLSETNQKAPIRAENQSGPNIEVQTIQFPPLMSCWLPFYFQVCSNSEPTERNDKLSLQFSRKVCLIKPSITIPNAVETVCKSINQKLETCSDSGLSCNTMYMEEKYRTADSVYYSTGNNHYDISYSSIRMVFVFLSEIVFRPDKGGDVRLRLAKDFRKSDQFIASLALLCPGAETIVIVR